MRTFTNTKLVSTHGTRKAAEAQAARRGDRSTSDYTVTHTVEHTGPRLFSVIRTEVLQSEAATVRHIMSGEQIQCRNCNGHYWFYTGRSLFNLNYECASCGNTISPVSETGASQ